MTTDSNGGKSKRSPKIDRTRNESIYLGLVTLLAIAVAILLLLLSAWSIFVPAIGISFLFGIAVATLAYTFLGGGGGDSIAIRGVQVSGATAVVVALILFTNGPLERQIGTLEQIEKLSRAAQAAEDRAKEAEDAARRVLIVERGTSEPIVGGGQVGLEDISTLNGWKEGPHSENKKRPNVGPIIDDLFARLDIHRSSAEILQMSDEEWIRFLESLGDGQRFFVGGVPFARLALQASDGNRQERTVFKKDSVPIVNKRGQIEAFLCIKRILDVRERTSQEPEIVVLSHSRGRCDEVA